MQLSSIFIAALLTISPLHLVLAQRRHYNYEVRDYLYEREPEYLDIEDVEIRAADLYRRAGTIKCTNQGNIKRVKPLYKGKCHPQNSVGYMGAHKCKTKHIGGHSYLCVQNDVATCYSVNEAFDKKLEYGECFSNRKTHYCFCFHLSLHYSTFTCISVVKMQVQLLSDSSPPSLQLFDQLATSAALDEITNIPGGIRHYIFHRGVRDKETGKTAKSLLFAIYQTQRYSPKTGYRVCLIHEGYYIASATKKEDEPEDEIDYLEKDIPRDSKEFVILGEDVLGMSEVVEEAEKEATN
ncbi:unnamed protein product [Clonostachys byssicola]|uniref:Uncharacterized protein n=1 Tax=Clonostachys byssicola TaxID=160290 RepID=A0A9N9UVL1_9HYPO|nr:unnamed protein product [Clonostachys byssicola]